MQFHQKNYVDVKFANSQKVMLKLEIKKNRKGMLKIDLWKFMWKLMQKWVIDVLLIPWSINPQY